MPFEGSGDGGNIEGARFVGADSPPRHAGGIGMRCGCVARREVLRHDHTIWKEIGRPLTRMIFLFSTDGALPQRAVTYCRRARRRLKIPYIPVPGCPRLLHVLQRKAVGVHRPGGQERGLHDLRQHCRCPAAPGGRTFAQFLAIAQILFTTESGGTSSKYSIPSTPKGELFMSVYKRGEVYWFKFTWKGQLIRESTKQGNQRVARQMEAARRTQLAKAEVGIKDPVVVPTLEEFLIKDFKDYNSATFAAKIATKRYYENGIRALRKYRLLAEARLDAITGDIIASYVAKRRDDGLKVASINRELQVLRRALRLAQEWGRFEKAIPRIRMLPGEAHRERILSVAEEREYFRVAQLLGDEVIAAYQRALTGIRATQRGETPIPPADPYKLGDVATLLMDCGLRPEECFRLRWSEVRDGAIYVLHGKTANARRQILLSPRAVSILEMRRAQFGQGEWVFPAPTRSGHMAPDSIKKSHIAACKEAGIEHIPLYTFRHTCLTRWATSGMDPWTLAHLAGHQDMSITRRYVHPNEASIRAAMERARAHFTDQQEEQGGHKTGHTDEQPSSGRGSKGPLNMFKERELDGAPGVIRTPDLLVRSQLLYPAELRAHT